MVNGIALVRVDMPTRLLYYEFMEKIFSSNLSFRRIYTMHIVWSVNLEAGDNSRNLLFPSDVVKGMTAKIVVDRNGV